MMYRCYCLREQTFNISFSQQQSNLSLTLSSLSFFLCTQMHREERLPEGHYQFASLARLRIRPAVYRFRASPAGSHPHRSNCRRKFLFLLLLHCAEKESSSFFFIGWVLPPFYFFSGSFSCLLTRLVTLSKKKSREDEHGEQLYEA